MTRRVGGRPSHPLAVLAVAGALVASLAGCLDQPVATPAPTPTREPDPTPVVTGYTLNPAAVWYEGLVISIDGVTATLDPRGGPVEVRIHIDNPNDQVGILDGPITLVAGGKSWTPTRESSVPEIPEQGTGVTNLVYELQGIASIEDAYITVGADPLHVARVPITELAPYPALTLEPVSLTLKGSGTAGSTKITLRTGLVRWDLPDWSQELDASLLALTVTYDVTYAGDFSGGQAFTGENVALRLPDGTVVEARADGHSQSVELIGARKTKKNLFSRFEIPSDATGTYAILVRSGSTVKAIPFTIGG